MKSTSLIFFFLLGIIAVTRADASAPTPRTISPLCAGCKFTGPVVDGGQRIRICLRWDQNGWNGFSRLEIASDYAFTNLTSRSPHDVFACPPIGACEKCLELPNDGNTFWWRVVNMQWFGTQAVHAGYWSSLQRVSFVTGPTQVPGTPSTISPKNDELINGSIVKLDWTRDWRAIDHYVEVQVYEGSAWVPFHSGWRTGCIQGGCTIPTSWTLNFPDDGKRYRWRVRGRNVLGESAFSSWAYFVNGESGPPDPPALELPNEGRIFEGCTAFRWRQARRATDYLLEIAEDEGMGNIFYSNAVPRNYNGLVDYVEIPQICPLSSKGRVLFYRVTSRNSYGSAPSAIVLIINNRGDDCYKSAVGSGSGTYVFRPEVHACYDDEEETYWLVDRDLRQYGMIDAFGIRTGKYPLFTPGRHTDVLRDDDNLWGSGNLVGPADQATNRRGVDLHVNLRDSWLFFTQFLGLRGADSRGYQLRGIVGVPSFSARINGKFFDCPCTNNAFFDGFSVNECQGTAAFGSRLDVVGHEVGHLHAANDTQIGTSLSWEGGAASEFFGDATGIAVEYWKNGATDWLMGTGAEFVRNICEPSRSLRVLPDVYRGANWFPAPGVDVITGCTVVEGCPGVGNDQCGIHTNMGVLDKVFCLMTGGDPDKFHNGVSVPQPMSPLDAYLIIRDGMKRSHGAYYFSDLKVQSFESAKIRYGLTDYHTGTTILAFEAVDIPDVWSRDLPTMTPTKTRTPTITRTPTRTPTRTRTPTPGPCYGDCNRNGVVEISEVVLAVNANLGGRPKCPEQDFRPRDGRVTINEVTAIQLSSRNGCRR